MKRQKHRRDDLEYRKLTDKLSDDSGEESELLPRKSTYQEPPTLEKTVEEGDTLQSLAIRYGCSVAELKRLNHILNDNEIYAKGVVKVPDRPFSTILAGVHASGRSSPNGRCSFKKNHNLNLLDNKLTDTLFLSLPSTSKDESFNEVIFNSTISSKPYDINVKETENTHDDEEEVTLLPKLAVDSTPVVTSRFTCNGADADISWIALVLFAVIVIIAVPLIYGYYIYEHPGQYHHHIYTNKNNSNHTINSIKRV